MGFAAKFRFTSVIYDSHSLTLETNVSLLVKL